MHVLEAHNQILTKVPFGWKIGWGLVGLSEEEMQRKDGDLVLLTLYKSVLLGSSVLSVFSISMYCFWNEQGKKRTTQSWEEYGETACHWHIPLEEI